MSFDCGYGRFRKRMYYCMSRSLTQPNFPFPEISNSKFMSNCGVPRCLAVISRHLRILTPGVLRSPWRLVRWTGQGVVSQRNSQALEYDEAFCQSLVFFCFSRGCCRESFYFHFYFFSTVECGADAAEQRMSHHELCVLCRESLNPAGLGSCASTLPFSARTLFRFPLVLFLVMGC